MSAEAREVPEGQPWSERRPPGSSSGAISSGSAAALITMVLPSTPTPPVAALIAWEPVTVGGLRAARGGASDGPA